jgi:hypothetical protein
MQRVLPWRELCVASTVAKKLYKGRIDCAAGSNSPRQLFRRAARAAALQACPQWQPDRSQRCSGAPFQHHALGRSAGLGFLSILFIKSATGKHKCA